MPDILKSWKTTAAGAGTIFTALGALATMASKGAWDAQAIGMAVMGIAAGVGLIFAKDGNVTGGTVGPARKSK